MPQSVYNTRILPAVVLLLALIFSESCSTTKDGTVYRAYHNTTAHYNGHFNAGESVKKGVAKIQSAHVEDYDQLLPLFIYGTEETAVQAYPEMEKAIEKCEKVIGKHTMTNQKKKGQKHPPFNKWIDDNYMLIGQSYFYKQNYAKAQDVFQYVNRKYKEKDTQITSATWLARSYIAREEYSKAQQALNRVEIEDDLSDKLKADYYLVLADNLIHQGKLPEAAEKLETGLTHIKRKRNRARPHFILAQIYQQLNKSSEAQREYDAVIKSRPPYELEFYSRINKALSYSRRGGSSAEIKKELFKMLKDEKNASYRDQIYFALGDIALEEQQREEAIGYFEKSLKEESVNPKQKAKTFLRLADLYFDQRQYSPAQQYYDSTFTKIDEAHPRYREIKARALSLNELVKYLDTIVLNDSLISLCDKTEEEREKVLRQALKSKEKEMERKRAEDEARAAEAMEKAATSIDGTFWCYNANLREGGQASFQDYWSDRPLKDYWRLQSRVSSLFDAPDESIIVSSSTESAGPSSSEDKYKVPTLDELRQQLPCKDEATIGKAREEVAEAYYKAGVLYKESLDDFDNAINSWEQLIRNMETSDFHPIAMYQLFRTWLNKEQLANYKANPFCGTCSSQYWAEQIRTQHPGSEWAKLVDNPEFLDMKELREAEERAAYETVYRMYTDRNYPAAVTACNTVIATQPENHLLCKYKLLKSICVGYSDAAYGITENYISTLTETVNTCKGTPEGDRAAELLAAAKKESVPESANNGGTDEATGEPATPAPAPETQPEEIYQFNESAEHYVAIIVPTKGTNINSIKASISDFNAEFYTSAALKVSNNLLNKDTHIVLIKPFKTAADGKAYHKVITENTTQLSDINEAGYTTFLISKPNYIQLFKTKNLEAYTTFYNEHY